MKNLFARWSVATAGTLAALTLVSCVYDPYYSSVGYSHGSYGGGYRSIDTSVFISTGNSRWGYDPYRSCYYDYQRHCYYDPFLYGYYPVNYCPPRLPGSPHPYGWRPGSGACPSPRNIRTGYLPNYQNRLDSFRGGDTGWNSGLRSRNDWNPQPRWNRDSTGPALQQTPFSAGFPSNRPVERPGFNGFLQNQQPDRQGWQPGQSGFGNRPLEGQSPQRPGFQQSRPPVTRYQTPIAYPDLQNNLRSQQDAAASRQRESAARLQEPFNRGTEAAPQHRAAWQQRVEDFRDKRDQR